MLRIEFEQLKWFGVIVVLWCIDVYESNWYSSIWLFKKIRWYHVCVCVYMCMFVYLYVWMYLYMDCVCVLLCMCICIIWIYMWMFDWKWTGTVLWRYCMVKRYRRHIYFILVILIYLLKMFYFGCSKWSSIL